MELETMLHIIAIVLIIIMFAMASVDAQNRTVNRECQKVVIIIDLIGMVNEFMIFAIRAREHKGVVFTGFMIVVWAYLALTTIEYLKRH